MKKIVKENLFYILFFIGFFLISLLFPYSGDDWVWGTYKLDLNTITNLSTELELNGRYIGNIIAIILTRNIFVRGVGMSLILTLLLKEIHKFTGGKNYLLLFLLLCMPATVFKQVIPWSAGFANYTVSILILFKILDLLLNNREEHYMLGFLLCFIGSMFLENFTIFILGLTLYLNIRYFIKHKKINKLYLFALLGSLLGTFIMFSQPSYIRNFNGDNESRQVGRKDNLIIHNYFYNFILYSVNANFLIFALLEIVLFLYAYKTDRFKNNILSLFGISYLMLFYLVLTESFQKLYNQVYLNGIVATIYLILIIIIMYKLFRKKEQFRYISLGILFCALITGPLFVVNTIGPRNFFIVYLIIGMIIIRLYNELFSETKLFRKIVIPVLIVLVGYYVFIFGGIHKSYMDRETYVDEHRCQNLIYIPRLVHHKYVWWPDFEYSLGDYYPNYYKKYNNLDEDTFFIFEDYDKWLSHKDNENGCEK